MNTPTKIILWVLFGLAVIAGIFYVVRIKGGEGKYDLFAQCLKDKDAKFYGAFWCPHCQNQKAMFGKSEKLLPYIECSTPDGNDQNAVCKDKKIMSYPTWEFADGSRETGKIPLQTLSHKTQCSLPN